MDEDLDISWVEEQEKLQSVDKNYFREPMEALSITVIYINTNGYIENIICEKHSLIKGEQNCSVLEKERFIQIIQNKKKTTPHSKYKFMDALLFNVTLEPENIQQFANNEEPEQNPDLFLKKITIIDDIVLPPSIFIFHNTNGLYLLFKEEPRTDITNMKTKSILKSDDATDKKTTKKVKLILRKQNLSTTKKRIKNEN